MRDPAAATTEEHWVIRLQPLSDVVGIQYGRLGRLGQPLSTHHGDVHPGNKQNARAAPRRGRNSTNALGSPSADHRMLRQKRSQMRSYTNGTHAWATTAMWDAKCFMQVNVANV